MTTLKNTLHDSNNGLDYTMVNGYYLPNLTAAAPAEHPTGQWGRLHKTYLKEQLALTVQQMQEAEGVTEALKAADQLEWVRRMNSIRNRAEEIIKTELIFV